jgi:hypothetical protein
MRRHELLIRRHHGATIIEFALVAFIMFLVFWGIFEFGRALYVRNTTQYLTRCMARSAVVHLPSDFALAKQECLLGPNQDTWPLYYVNDPGVPLPSQFQLGYSTSRDPNVDCSQTGVCLSETDVGGKAYDNQASACLTTPSQCIRFVQAYYVGDPIATFGILTSWIGGDSALAEPKAQTTMPAENMGWVPPS